jgi:hypothetical protein
MWNVCGVLLSLFPLSNKLRLGRTISMYVKTGFLILPYSIAAQRNPGASQVARAHRVDTYHATVVSKDSRAALWPTLPWYRHW